MAEASKPVEVLIKLVESEPAIYDPQKKQDCHFINNFWTDVEKKMGLPEWKETKCRATWKNLRDTFRRKWILGKRARGKGKRRLETWEFYDQLKFLTPYMENHETNTNVRSDSRADGPIEDVSEEDETSDADSDDSLSTASRTPSKKAKKQRCDWEALMDVHKCTNQMIQDQLNKKKSPFQEFWGSFATRMENLEPHIESVVRIQIAQIFHNATTFGKQPPVPLTAFQANADGQGYRQPQYQFDQFPQV